MILRPGTRAELEVGMYLADAAGKTWKVNAESQGWLQLVDAQGNLQPVLLDPATPVRIFEMTEQDALDLVSRELGGSRIMLMEEIGTQDRRSWQLTVGVEKDARGLAGHLEFMHGGISIPITAVAKKSRGTDPDFAEMSAYHDKLHADALTGRHVMRFAHHHDPAFDSGGTR